MTIPEYYLSPDFWRRLIQMAEKLLRQKQFPNRRYENDINTLIEDVIQEVLLRVHMMDEPETPIARWPGFFYRVMEYVVMEKRREAFKLIKIPFEYVGVEIPVAGPPLDERLEGPELDEEEDRVVDPRFWQMAHEELSKIADEQCRECFRRFVKLVWYQGRSRRAAWKEIQPDCHGDRWATFNRWLNKLRLAVMKRWAKG